MPEGFVRWIFRRLPVGLALVVGLAGGVSEHLGRAFVTQPLVRIQVVRDDEAGVEIDPSFHAGFISTVERTGRRQRWYS